MSLTEVPPTPTDDLRRGPRVPVLEDVFVNWIVPSPGVEPASGAQRRRRGGAPEAPVEAVGRVVDMSHHGVAVVAPVSDHLEDGSVVRVRMGRAPATLRIRHVTDIGEPEWRLYGAEIVNADPTFQRYVAWWMAMVEAPDHHVVLEDPATLLALAELEHAGFGTGPDDAIVDEADEAVDEADEAVDEADEAVDEADETEVLTDG